jgi:hypothetical protein
MVPSFRARSSRPLCRNLSNIECPSLGRPVISLADVLGLSVRSAPTADTAAASCNAVTRRRIVCMLMLLWTGLCEPAESAALVSIEGNLFARPNGGREEVLNSASLGRNRRASKRRERSRACWHRVGGRPTGGLFLAVRLVVLPHCVTRQESFVLLCQLAQGGEQLPRLEFEAR